MDVYLGRALSSPEDIVAVRAQLVLWLRSLSVDLLPGPHEMGHPEPLAESLTISDLAASVENGFL